MKKNYNYDFSWQKMPEHACLFFEGLTTITGQVSEFALQALPSGQQKMAGLHLAQWSGYAGTDIKVADGITGLGEIVTTRIGQGLSKSYAYPVGRSGEELCLGKEFKGMPGHHAPIPNPAPPENVFGYFPWSVVQPSGLNLTFQTSGSGIDPLADISGSRDFGTGNPLEYHTQVVQPWDETGPVGLATAGSAVAEPYYVGANLVEACFSGETFGVEGQRYESGVPVGVISHQYGELSVSGQQSGTFANEGTVRL